MSPVRGDMVKICPKRLLPCGPLRAFRPADRRRLDFRLENRRICVAPIHHPILRLRRRPPRDPREVSVCSGPRDPGHTRDAHHQQLPSTHSKLHAPVLDCFREIASRFRAPTRKPSPSVAFLGVLTTSSKNPAFHDAEPASVDSSNLPKDSSSHW